MDTRGTDVDAKIGPTEHSVLAPQVIGSLEEDGLSVVDEEEEGGIEHRIPRGQDRARRELLGTAFGISALRDMIKLSLYVCLWYFFNVQYNIENKKLLNVFGATYVVSWVQLFAGIPIAALMWATCFLSFPKLSKSDVIKLLPVGVVFACGQVATVSSLGSVAVSFTHVVKALEPAVNAILSALVLGHVFHPVVYASLVPIFLGVALASASEISFTRLGFFTAMTSNFAFATRNVLATKLGEDHVGEMGETKTLRQTNLLAVLTILATTLYSPIFVFIPGGLLSAPEAWERAVKAGMSPSVLMYMFAVSGFYFFMYQMSSFWVLSCVQPITHSVLNALKRAVIIIATILIFQNPITPRGALGTAMALGGVLSYSLAKVHYGKKV